MHLVWKIAVGEYVFRYKIYPSANLVLKCLVLKYDITATKIFEALYLQHVLALLLGEKNIISAFAREVTCVTNFMQNTF